MTVFHHGHIQIVVVNTLTSNLNLTVVGINVVAICLYSSRLDYLSGLPLSNFQCAVFFLYKERVITYLHI